MSATREILRRNLPARLVAALRPLSRRILPLRARLDWEWNPRRWANASRIERFRGLHAGKRCFVIGNGPSLARMDLSPLRHELTFGLNRIYLLFPRLGFTTTYLVSVNELVIRQFWVEIGALRMPKFLSWYARRVAGRAPDIVYVRDPRDGSLGFSKNPARAIWEGATVTYVALQLAHYMGFHRVILIGVDHNFETKGPAHAAVVSTGVDPNHFAPDYFGPGVTWNLPDLETSEAAYRLARAAFASDGREVVDATVGGKLQVFPKVAYGELF